jgi:hypothetical protein
MRRFLKEVVIILLGIISVIYLANPTAGFLELIPDAVPLIGNLDEATAVLILLSTLRYYGIDPSKLWGRPDQAQLPANTEPNKRDVEP